MGALTSPDVGKYVNEHFASSFQKVATFKIVDGQKQGGNVAAYFCAPDGRVLHLIAGPVDAATFLREAKWVVETAKDCIERCKGDGGKFKAMFRIAHAERFRQETGLQIEPVTFDPPGSQDPKDALTFHDPSGRPLAPRLPPPPIDGPDVRLKQAEFEAKQNAANTAPGARAGLDKRGGRIVVNNAALVHQLLAAHALCPIEQIYGTVFENILGEKISTKPVDVKGPFSWVDRNGNRIKP